MVVSVSWPTPETTGSRTGPDGAGEPLVVEGHQVLQGAAAPDQQHHLGAVHRLGPLQGQNQGLTAPSPCTVAGESTRSTQGARRPTTVRTSRSAAPLREVTTTTRRGRSGRGRFRASSKSPSAASALRRCSTARAQGADPGGLQPVRVELVAPLGVVDLDAAVDDHSHPVLGPEGDLRTL